MAEAPGIRKTDSKDLIGQKAESPERDGLSAFSISCLRPGIEIIPGAKCTFEVRLHRSKISEIPAFPPFSKSGKGSPHSAAAGNRCGSGWMESKLRRRNSPLFPKRKPKARGELSKAGFFAFTSRKWRGGFKRGRRGGGRLFKVLHILNGAEEADAVSFPNRPDFESIPSEL